MQRLGTNIVRTPSTPLSPTQSAALQALQTQRRVTAYPYYSTVAFVVFKQGDEPGPYNYPMNRGVEARAFSYGVGQQMTNAIGAGNGQPLAGNGAPVATPADTNLTNASETISGENVEIYGLSIQVKQYGLALHANDIGQLYLPDAQLLAALQTHCSVDLSLNGDQNRFHLGVLSQMPGGGGLMGSGLQQTVHGSLPGERNELAFPNNGWPTRSNYFRLPEGLIWRNKGNADSQLNVIFRVERRFDLLTGGFPRNFVAPQGTDRPADPVSGVEGYNFPDLLEVVLLVQLHGRVIGPRTRSA